MKKNNLESEIDFLQELTLGDINFLLNFEYNLREHKNVFFELRYRVDEYINVHKKHEMEFIVYDTKGTDIGKIVMDDFRVSVNPYITNKTYLNLMNSRFGGRQHGKYTDQYPYYLQSKIYRQVKEILKKSITANQILEAVSNYLNVKVNLQKNDGQDLLTFLKSKRFLEYIKKSIEKVSEISNQIKINNKLRKEGVKVRKNNKLKLSTAQACYAKINNRDDFINHVDANLKSEKSKDLFYSFMTGRPVNYQPWFK